MNNDPKAPQRWYSFGNCASQDLANAINNSSCGIEVQAFWLSSPLTILSYREGACLPLIEHQALLKGSLESRFVANQFLLLDSEARPERVLLNLFHIENSHYRERSSGTIFYLPHKENLPAEVLAWLEQDCEPASGEAGIHEYLKVIEILHGRFGCEIDLIVRRSLRKYDSCYLSPWRKDQAKWIATIESFRRPFLNVFYLDAWSKDSWYPYFTVETRGIFKRSRIIRDREHMSHVGFAELVKRVYSCPTHPGLSDPEWDWSEYLRSAALHSTGLARPRSDFPVSKYLLRSLKEVLKIKRIPVGDVIETHRDRVRVEFPNDGFHQRYLAQCDAILSLFEVG